MAASRPYRSLYAIVMPLLTVAAPATAALWHADVDTDGYGDPFVTIEAAEQPVGYVADGTDCDDENPLVNPGAVEVCDGVDNNCDYAVDEPGAAGSTAYYQDLDGDGYGSDVEGYFCSHPGQGWSDYTGDCDDVDWNVYPGAVDECDGIDNDCDGVIDDGQTGVMHWVDNDGDGFGGDYGVMFCWDPGQGWAQDPGDCDDADPEINPLGSEVCDGKDNDCNGLVDDGLPGVIWYADLDGDGYGAGDPVVHCDDPGPFWSQVGGDCDDDDPYVNPGAVDECDGVDNDCDGLVDGGDILALWYPDLDDDAFGDAGDPGAVFCQPPGAFWSLDATDCDDDDPAVFPGATEVWDGVDNDCDGVIDGLRIRITDIGDDQGRVVRVNWTRHGEDAPGTEYDVTGYTLYRRIDDAKASAAPVKAAPPGLWDYVNTIPAHGEDQYFVLAPTLGDSTSHDIVWSVFFLRAETTDPLVFFDSAPDSGYSVDNLAPPAPSGLQAASVPGGTSLTWIESQVPDLFYYRVYRGATPDFPLTVDTLVYFTTGLAWLDPQTDPARPFYKVTALDITGNESPAAVVESTTGAGDATPLAAVLHPNRPNPFNPTTTFAFEVPRDDRVTLTIHALDGRVVAQLVDDVLAAGSHTATWRGAYDDGRAAPSGVYLARYVTGGVSTSRRVMLVR